jgi:NADP-dependent 3-hydroxy acid dehydrogenase YdfG
MMTNTQGITGKVVAITGASSGIGESTALHLAALGAKVVLGARRTDRLEVVAARIRSTGGEALFTSVDVSRRADLTALVDLAVDTFGRLDVLFSNAGVMPISPLDELRVDDWEDMIDVNVKGVLYGIAAALPVFRAQKSGHFITTGSTATLRIVPTMAVYSGSKLAVRAITEGLRQEAGPDLRVTLITPGMTATEGAGAVTNPEIRANLQKSLDSLAMPPSTIARAIAYAYGTARRSRRRRDRGAADGSGLVTLQLRILQRTQVAPPRDNLGDSQERVERSPGLLRSGTCKRPDGEPHDGPGAMDDEGLLAVDRVPGQRSIREAHPIGTVHDFPHLHRLGHRDARHPGGDDEPEAGSDGGVGVDGKPARRLDLPTEHVVRASLPGLVAEADDGRDLRAPIAGRRGRPDGQGRCRGVATGHFARDTVTASHSDSPAFFVRQAWHLAVPSKARWGEAEGLRHDSCAKERRRGSDESLRPSRPRRRSVVRRG